MNERAEFLINRLSRVSQEGSLPHAFLITGASAEMREEFAFGLAKKIYADDELASEKIDSGNFEDLIVLRPDGDSIKVMQIDELTGVFKNKPFAHSSMMAMITDGETMTTQAQNKLLKTLEEPAAGNILMILTGNPESLTKTIHSRSVRLSLGGLEIDPDPEIMTEAKNLLSLALNKSRPISEGFASAERFAGKAGDENDQTYELLTTMQYFLRDIIVGGFTEDLVSDETNREIASKMKQRQNTLKAYVGIVEKSISKMKRKMNRKNCLKDMLLKMRMEVS